MTLELRFWCDPELCVDACKAETEIWEQVKRNGWASLSSTVFGACPSA